MACCTFIFSVKSDIRYWICCLSVLANVVNMQTDVEQALQQLKNAYLEYTILTTGLGAVVIGNVYVTFVEVCIVTVHAPLFSALILGGCVVKSIEAMLMGTFSALILGHAPFLK